MDYMYTCPRCRNVFPITNKIMHDLYCTDLNPMPLDQSRRNIQNNEPHNSNQNLYGQNNQQFPNNMDFNPYNEEIKNNKKETHKKKKKHHNEESHPHNPDEDKIPCEICNNLINVNEYKDHVYCHQLQQKELRNYNRINNNRNNNRNNNNRNNNNRNNNNNNRIRSAHPQRSTNSNNSFGPSIGITGMGFPMITITSSNPFGGRVVRRMQMGNDDFFEPFRSRAHRVIMPFGSILAINNMDDILRIMAEQQGVRDNPTDEAILNNLPETNIEDATKLDADKKNCVICLEDFKNGDKATVLPCIHMFHSNCLIDWLKTQNSCPICKFKLTAENINRNFQ